MSQYLFICITKDRDSNKLLVSRRDEAYVIQLICQRGGSD